MFILTKIAAAVAVLSMLVAVSKLFQPLRETLPGFYGLFYCPICLGFWFALPTIYEFGLGDYFTVVAMSNLWMLGIAKLYVELDIMSDS